MYRYTPYESSGCTEDNKGTKDETCSDNSSDSEKLGGAVLNVLIVMVILIVMTFALVWCYKKKW